MQFSMLSVSSWLNGFWKEKNSQMDYLDLIQWPAMLATVAAACLVASLSKRRRSLGFWIFLLSNALWIVWGWHDHAHALIGLQIFLALLNIRGAYKNDPDTVPNRA